VVALRASRAEIVIGFAPPMTGGLAHGTAPSTRRSIAPLLRVAAICTGLVLAGCHRFDPNHPNNGHPSIPALREPAFWIWHERGSWHVQIAPGSRGHRFQGSLAGVRGGIAGLQLSRVELSDRVAAMGDAVQFDLESVPGAPVDAFTVQVAGGCARFDLYVDGRRRAEHVRLGPRGMLPRQIPFERCP
jgi:hypothetical protein